MPDSNGKPKRKRGLILLGIVLIAFISLSVVFYPKAKEKWSAPLGPGLGLPTLSPTVPSPTETELIAAVLASTELSSLPTSASSPTATRLSPTLTPTQAPLCGGPPVMTILGIGADNRDNTYLYGLADVIRIARIDFVTPKITVLSMPRDLWVDIPDISEHYNITNGKINQAYLYGGPGMGYYTGPGGGPGLLARTLDLNYGLRVEHYGAVNMQTFVKIVNAVGGLDIYLPIDVDGTPIDANTEDMGYFTAGQHHFTGDQALRFARIRKRYNDFTRADNQTMVLCALRKKILTPSVLPKIPKIIAAFQDSVQTDLSLEQISQLACLLPKVDSSQLIFTGLPDDLLKPGRIFSENLKNDTYILEADNNAIREKVSEFMSGTWPTEPDEPDCP